VKRVATAAVAIAVFLLANHYRTSFEILVLLCAAGASLELARLSRQPYLGVALRCNWLVLLVLFTLLALSWWGGAWAAAALLLIAPAVRGWSDPNQAFRSVSFALMAALWLGVLPAAMILLRRAPAGEWTLTWLLGAVALGDAAAFYAGSALGRHKLAPSVSPNKTVEGAVAGLLASAGAGLLAAWALFPAASLPRMVLASVALGAAGQLGDLFESLLKRAAGVKDSGAWLPGHGGLLDRLDAILFAGLALLLLRSWALS
jgi:CDP-diglyceride synthetase